MCGNAYGKQNQEKLIVSPEKVSGKINTVLPHVGEFRVSIQTNEHAKKTKEEL